MEIAGDPWFKIKESNKEAPQKFSTYMSIYAYVWKKKKHRQMG